MATKKAKKPAEKYKLTIRRGTVKGVNVDQGDVHIGTAARITTKKPKRVSYISYNTRSESGLKAHKTEKAAVRRLPKAVRAKVAKKL